MVHTSPPAGDATHDKLIRCTETCQDRACFDECIAGASPEGLAAGQALDQCVFTDNGCDGRETDCAIQNCAEQITACFGEAVCGNDWRDPGEGCDDGNQVNGDGCAADCSLEGVAACVDDRFEDNDDRASATDVDAGLLEDLQICADDADWYRIPVCAGGRLDIDVLFTSADGDLDILLTDADGAELDFSESIDDNESISYVNGAVDATYFLEVAGFEGAANTYDLRTRILGCGDPDACGNGASTRARSAMPAICLMAMAALHGASMKPLPVQTTGSKTMTRFRQRQPWSQDSTMT